MNIRSKLVMSLALLLSPAFFCANAYANVYADAGVAQPDNVQIVEPESIIPYLPVELEPTTPLPNIPDTDFYAASIPDTTYSAILPLAELYDEMYDRQSPDIQCHVSTISVSSLKVTWTYVEDHKYEISCIKSDKHDDYSHNICLNSKTPDSCYITGLREDTSYIIKVKDLTTGKEEAVLGQTEKVNVIQTYDYISGWTNCFTYESASGLTHNPSKSAIAGSISDPVTGTGIMRDEYGDYCAAMGLYFGRCGDRFLIELENGTQFTVKICDSKGYASDGQGKYHTFGRSRNGKSVVEFIHGTYLPDCVRRSGNYGSYDWDGLKFDNIKSVCKIEYGDTVVY